MWTFVRARVRRVFSANGSSVSIIGLSCRFFGFLSHLDEFDEGKGAQYDTRKFGNGREKAREC